MSDRNSPEYSEIAEQNENRPISRRGVTESVPQNVRN